MRGETSKKKNKIHSKRNECSEEKTQTRGCYKKVGCLGKAWGEDM